MFDILISKKYVNFTIYFDNRGMKSFIGNLFSPLRIEVFLNFDNSCYIKCDKILLEYILNEGARCQLYSHQGYNFPLFDKLVISD